MKQLINPKQEKFCIEFQRTGNATESYQQVYGVKDSASAQAGSSRLLADERVQTRLKELSENLKDSTIADIKELQAGLTKIFRGEITTPLMTKDGEIINAPVSTKDRLKAAEILCKTQGAFLTRQEVEMTAQPPIVIFDNIS